MIVDPLWTGGYAVKLTEKIGNNGTGNMTVKRGGITIQYETYACTYNDDNEKYMVFIKPTETKAPKPSDSRGAVATVAY